jgi:hypothetical protein
MLMKQLLLHSHKKTFIHHLQGWGCNEVGSEPILLLQYPIHNFFYGFRANQIMTGCGFAKDIGDHIFGRKQKLIAYLQALVGRQTIQKKNDKNKFNKTLINM